MSWLAIAAWLLIAGASARGDILVSDKLTNDVLRYSDTGTPLGSFIAVGNTKPDGPIGVKFGPDGYLYVASSNDNELLRYDRDGKFVDVFATGGALHGPADIEVGPDGNLYVANFDNFSGTSIEVFDPWAKTPAARYVGTFASASASVPLNGPTFLEFGRNGNLYVSATSVDQVLEFTAAGGFVGTYAAGAALGYPAGLAFDSANRLYVASLLLGPVLRDNGAANSGLSVYVPGTLNVDFPSDVQFDYNGDLLVSQLTGGGVYRYHEDSITHKLTTTPLTSGALQPAQFTWRPVLGDANGDRMVTGADYTVWADHFEQTVRLGPTVGDFNFDGKVTGADYTVWADHFTTPAASAALPVPEPASRALAAVALACVACVAARAGRGRSRR
ncbi:MAG: hypothetical protein K2Y37_19365 [Pirellulales bacterium]|nr:hypothetical protein [Pirellulales bacterium]